MNTPTQQGSPEVAPGLTAGDYTRMYIYGNKTGNMVGERTILTYDPDKPEVWYDPNPDEPEPWRIFDAVFLAFRLLGC